jgi:hypothetical protein
MEGVSVTTHAINHMVRLPTLKVDCAVVVNEAYGINDKAQFDIIKIFYVSAKHAWVTFVICVRVGIGHIFLFEGSYAFLAFCQSVT